MRATTTYNNTISTLAKHSVRRLMASVHRRKDVSHFSKISHLSHYAPEPRLDGQLSWHAGNILLHLMP